ncbi:hypothetical protein CCO48_26540 [Salmonella enterica subsp. enterica serovar Altendorf]|nr:hypothetical protein CCO48_26540 [Salmonella enterica subsp. enterica serovar Altendorf]
MPGTVFSWCCFQCATNTISPAYDSLNQTSCLVYTDSKLSGDFCSGNGALFQPDPPGYFSFKDFFLRFA